MTRNDLDPKWPDRGFEFDSDGGIMCYSNVLINNEMLSVSESCTFLDLYLKKLRILFVFFMLALFILSWYWINLLTYFWISLFFTQKTLIFPLIFAILRGWKLPSEPHFPGSERVFLPAFCKSSLSCFYLDNAIFYNKEMWFCFVWDWILKR